MGAQGSSWAAQEAQRRLRGPRAAGSGGPGSQRPPGPPGPVQRTGWGWGRRPAGAGLQRPGVGERRDLRARPAPARTHGDGTARGPWRGAAGWPARQAAVGRLPSSRRPSQAAAGVPSLGSPRAQALRGWVTRAWGAGSDARHRPGLPPCGPRAPPLSASKKPDDLPVSVWGSLGKPQ
ncbi:hypothetical protein X798_07426, partial [Onchocerca flexuosa]